ncbi:hypothetical protein TNCV_1313831 [Trichonephila clavipes]|nr:hypothetical protein TNCV_1313831 [Trichonephila clavipes]
MRTYSFPQAEKQSTSLFSPPKNLQPSQNTLEVWSLKQKTPFELKSILSHDEQRPFGRHKNNDRILRVWRPKETRPSTPTLIVC